MGLKDLFRSISVPKESIAMRDRAIRLHQVGINATGTLNGCEETGRRDIGGGIEYRFDVHVTPPEGSAYDVTFTQYMLAGQLGDWVQPGNAVNVRIDPQDPSAAMMMGPA